jgi:nitroreductase
MKTVRTIPELIRERSSWRSYTDDPIEEPKRAALREAMAALEPPFGSQLRFELIELDGLDAKQLRALGTYGFIKNPRAFLAGAVVSGPKALEDFGWAMESLVLLATDFGLATCWLGGSFSNSAFGAQLKARPEELVPAVSPLGYGTGRRSARDRVIRFVAGSKDRKPWEALFFSGAPGSPLSREEAGAWAEPLELTRLAPSASNKQPWRVVRVPEGFHFYLERTPGYGVGLERSGKADLQRVDMGIAMCHFELAARAAGLEGAWSAEAAPAVVGLEHAASWLLDASGGERT